MAKYKKCPNCGTLNEINEGFCIECNQALTDAEIIDDNMKKNETLDNTENIEGEISEKTITCPYCGSEVNADEKICPQCFARLDNINFENNVQTSNLFLVFDNETYKINNGDIVGRHEKLSEILNLYSTVSRKHAKFMLENGNWYVEDLNSTNGTYINDNKITKQILTNGDKISFSSKVTFRVEIN